MSDNIRKLLQPQYLSTFQCIGPACEDSCCIGWRVQIDKETYQRYRECPDTDLRPQMDAKVKRHRTNAGESNYAKIKLNKDGSCPFIDADKLCSIQRKLGEDYLSVTCATYPRTVNTVNHVLEKSLTMSCPEAARLALLDPRLMSFDETVEEGSRHRHGGRVIDTADYKTIYTPLKYFWELRIFIIALIQNRAYPLWQRLIILGLFCRQLEAFIDEGKVQEIPLLIGRYINYLEQGDFREELNAVPHELTIQMELMKEIADERVASGVTSKRFMECFAEFLLGIQYTAGSAKEDIGQRYAQAAQDYYHPLMEQHEYILENYLVNYVFKNLFPFDGEKRVFDNYVKLIVHYAMIKLFLIGMAGCHKENFNTDHVVKLIQSFSKTVEHNAAYLKNILALLRANGFNTMPYMAILIKN